MVDDAAVVEAAAQLLDEGTEPTIASVSKKLFYSRTAVQGQVGNITTLKRALWWSILGAMAAAIQRYSGGHGVTVDYAHQAIRAFALQYPGRMAFMLAAGDEVRGYLSTSEFRFLKFSLGILGNVEGPLSPEAVNAFEILRREVVGSSHQTPILGLVWPVGDPDSV